MSPIEVIELIQQALFVLMKIAAPVMLVALLVGLVIALFQALTQIQEQTLTFVPKIVAIFFCLMLVLPFMLETLTMFTEGIADKIITVESRE